MNWSIQAWPPFAVPGVVFLLILAVALLIKRIIVQALQNWAAKTSASFDDSLVRTVNTPMTLWALMLAIHVATQVSTLPPRVTELTSRILLILWVVSLTLVASRIAAGSVRHWGRTVAGAAPVTTLTQNLARWLVMAIGLLILLNQFGISITPILTALGVGGLAVALALQDTLANLFAGFYISVAGQIRLNDYVKLDTGEEGYVTDINWRSTSIRALANNLVVVPNSKLAQAIVTNYYLPEKRMSLLIPIRVSYGCDPQRIEEILVEEAKRGARETPGLLTDPEPFVRFIPGFGESSLDFT
ncbi:MAG: mechanosensitive ion channel family protein, partial [Phycisphaerales bacterium]|nr:mechanosensitive ion channel family protein [Phycisphaerales bacterium]